MSNEMYHQHSLPSYAPSIDYITRFDAIEEFNYHQINNNVSPWIIPRRTIKRNSSQKIPLNSTSSNIIEPQLKNKNSKNALVVEKHCNRIDLLSRPKFRVQSQTSKSSSINVSYEKDKNVDGKNEKSNVNDSPSTSTRFRAVTPRILRLAQPKLYNLRQCPIGDTEKIDVMKMSKRISELAEPKKLQLRTNKDPFKVNPKALKASCSTRIEQLARPKGFSQPFPQIFQDYLDRVFIGS